MKAISLWQPHAQLLVLGPKRFETRSWPLPYWAVGVKIAIHAAKHVDGKNRELCTATHFMEALYGGTGGWGIDSLPLGSIVGWVKFSEPWNTNHPKFPAMLASMTEVERSFGDFDPNRWAWPVTQFKKLDVPIPFKGRQGFFNVPDDLIPL